MLEASSSYLIAIIKLIFECCYFYLCYYCVHYCRIRIIWWSDVIWKWV